MSTFAQPLGDELSSVVSERVHARESVIAERFAALRWSLERCNEIRCDGYTTAETPGFAPEVPIEVKAVRVQHHDGTGRVNVHAESHAELAAAGGWYAIVVYATVGDGEHIVALAADLVPASAVGQYVDPEGGRYQKVVWTKLLDPDRHDVDLARWSA